MGAGVLLLGGAIGYLLFAGFAPLGDLVIFQGWKQFFPTYYFMSWLVGLGCFYMVALAGVVARRELNKRGRSLEFIDGVDKTIGRLKG